MPGIVRSKITIPAVFAITKGSLDRFESIQRTKPINSDVSQRKGLFMRLLPIMFLICLHTSSSLAAGPAAPTGEVVLTISGNIEQSNSVRGAEFDLEMLEALGATSITTESPWTDGKTTFTGVRLSELLSSVGARSSSFRAIAFDGYWYDIANIDFEKYPIIVAYKRNGKYMSTRDLGPLWIMYPFDDYPELLTEANKASCIWHVESLVFQ